MNEEVAKILELLEAGKVSADEAERLIRAVNAGRQPSEEGEPIAGGPERASEKPRAPGSPFRDLEDLFRCVGRAAERAARRKRRWAAWGYYSFLRSQEEARRQRAETMNTFERIRFVLRTRAMLDTPEIELDSPLHTREMDRPIASDLLRVALEHEFGVGITLDELRALNTVADLVELIETRTGGSSPTPAAESAGGESPVEEPA